MKYFVIVYNKVLNKNTICLETFDYKEAINLLNKLTKENKTAFIDYTNG